MSFFFTTQPAPTAEEPAASASFSLPGGRCVPGTVPGTTLLLAATAVPTVPTVPIAAAYGVDHKGKERRTQRPTGQHGHFDFVMTYHVIDPEPKQLSAWCVRMYTRKTGTARKSACGGGGRSGAVGIEIFGVSAMHCSIDRR